MVNKSERHEYRGPRVPWDGFRVDVTHAAAIKGMCGERSVASDLTVHQRWLGNAGVKVEFNIVCNNLSEGAKLSGVVECGEEAVSPNGQRFAVLGAARDALMRKCEACSFANRQS